MESKAKKMGHPIHPILIPFPLGLLSTSVVFDVVHLLTGNGKWSEVSFWMIAVGVIGGLAAAVFGLIDWLAIPSGTRAKAVGMWHGATNVVMVTLFIASWLLRADAPGIVAIVLSFVAVGLASLGGFLGGELVVRLGVGVAEGAHLNAPSSLSGHPVGRSSTGTRGEEQQRLPVVHEGFVAMGRSAGVAQTHEVTEGKTHIADGVASSRCLGAGDDMTPDDASAVGGIVTALGHTEQKGRNDTWRVLTKLSVSSEPGNERLAMERVAAVVKELGLSEQRLERLKTAVAETTMNAMEHGNRYRSEVPVVIEVLSSGADLSVRINDQGGIRDPAPDKEVPNLEAKLEGLQTPRGWGLFLIRNMVDEIHITSDEVHHTVGLVMHL